MTIFYLVFDLFSPRCEKRRFPFQSFIKAVILFSITNIALIYSVSSILFKFTHKQLNQILFVSIKWTIIFTILAGLIIASECLISYFKIRKEKEDKDD